MPVCTIEFASGRGTQRKLVIRRMVWSRNAVNERVVLAGVSRRICPQASVGALGVGDPVRPQANLVLEQFTSCAANFHSWVVRVR